MLLRSRQESTPHSSITQACGMSRRPRRICSRHSAKKSAKQAANSTSLVYALAKAMCEGYSAKKASAMRAARREQLRESEAHSIAKHQATPSIWIRLHTAMHRSNESSSGYSDTQKRSSSVCSSGWKVLYASCAA